MKKTKKILGLLVISFLMLGAHESYAKKAEMVLIPTRIVLEKDDRFATLAIKNSGDATGQFKIDIVDMIMTEEGAVREIEPGEKPQYSAKDMIKISPKSVTIKPEQSQNVRVLIRKPSDLADGEYRAHVKVRMVNDNAEAEEELTKDETAVKVKANIVVIIPVIIRQGKTEFKSSITEASLIKNNQESGKPAVSLYLNNDGNRSSMGDLKIVQVLKGEEKTIAMLQGVPVYRGVAKRKVVIPIEVTEGLNVDAGKIKAEYFAQEKEGGKLLTEVEVKR